METRTDELEVKATGRSGEQNELRTRYAARVAAVLSEGYETVTISGEGQTRSKYRHLFEASLEESRGCFAFSETKDAYIRSRVCGTVLPSGTPAGAPCQPRRKSAWPLGFQKLKTYIYVTQIQSPLSSITLLHCRYPNQASSCVLQQEFPSEQRRKRAIEKCRQKAYRDGVHVSL